jgi:hopene-associated glycosyltransferase HpnB
MSVLAIAALLAWIYLVTLHGRFWQAGPVLPKAVPRFFPSVSIVVPARDEADGIAASIGSLLAQDYPGVFEVVLVDDNSTDATAALARSLARDLPNAGRLRVIDGAPRPPGWAGKLWAVHQGVDHSTGELVLLTDADIVHDPAHLSSLVAHLQAHALDMTSEMVALRCESLAERALIPAFVYFFALLYPFAWVNDGLRKTAAAAGGTVLIRRAALGRVGGIASISGALIDDVALATRVKRGGRIWLGHSALAKSVRPYPGAADVWRMIARSAYVQLKLSPWMLAGSLAGLFVLFLVPPLATFGGSVVGAAAWALMAASFWPSLKRFGLNPLWSLALPLMALFYMAATFGSALDHHRGRGVVWKSRAYGKDAA